MNKPFVQLQPSEGIIVNAAATIYSAYIQAGRVSDGRGSVDAAVNKRSHQNSQGHR